MTIPAGLLAPACASPFVSEPTRWAFPAEMQPAQGEVRFNLKSALDAVVALRADIPEDAFTAPILGTERTGSGVVIGDDGLVLTIGYLVTEAESIWLSANDGTVVPGHPIAFDFATGLGLVLPLSPYGLGAETLTTAIAAIAQMIVGIAPTAIAVLSLLFIYLFPHS